LRFSLLNPIKHARTEPAAKTYRVEPYVIAADVYSVPPHVGRGGWTWYTGSAGWMYRAGLEAILGVTREGSQLRIKPCIVGQWDGFELAIQFGATRYEINLIRDDGKAEQKSPEAKRLSPGEFLIALKDEGGVRRITLPFSAVQPKT
jgi:cyclic beta-1,2-glucan synthetase